MKRLLLVIVTVLLVSQNITLAGTKGKVAGRITDALTGEALPFVNVIIMGTNLGAATDIDGYYSILNISPGLYTIKASAIGYNNVSVENVSVSIDLTTTLDFQLSSESVELGEEVVVIATRELIKKDLTASTSIVGDDVISQLPVTDIGDVLKLQAGVVVSQGGDIHIRGGRSNQVVYQIDGVPVTDVYDGKPLVSVNQNAVQELQVISGAYNAEYGQAQSGVVNIVTKSGNNDFNFNFQTFIGDYVSNRTDIYDNIDNYNPVAIRNFEGSLSGPIIQDDLFFYVNGRYYFNSGSLYGTRTHLITDRAFENPITQEYIFVPDSARASYLPSEMQQYGESVSMNESETIYGQGKLTYRLLQGLKVSFNYITDRRNYRDYNHFNKLTPDNNLNRFNKSYTNILAFNHAISANSFYTLNLSYSFKDYSPTTRWC